MKEPIASFEKITYEQFEKDIQNVLGSYVTNAKTLYDNIILPRRATEGSAGYDFFAPYGITIPSEKSVVIPTGIRCNIKDGWFLMMVPKSGMGFKTGIRLANTLGIIDSDYYNADNEGHIMIKYTNESSICSSSIDIQAEKSFVQGIFLPYGIAENDNASAKRTGGFGSTN